jgi:NAD(P)-dependent dehydrogenase (short-subunit alcohol dehydrogenase family)
LAETTVTDEARVVRERGETSIVEGFDDRLDDGIRRGVGCGLGRRERRRRGSQSRAIRAALRNSRRDDVSDKAVKKLRVDLLPTTTLDRPLGEVLDLRGTCAAVTGGGGANLGQSIVNRFAGLGAAVAVIGRDGKSLEKVAVDAAARWGVDVVATTADVSNWDDAHRAAHETRERLGALDVWVNNAGGGSQGSFAAKTKMELDATVSGNLMTTFYATHTALEVMLAQRHGRIINIVSEGGRTGMPGFVAYSACKAGVIGLTRSLAHEIGPQGVTIAAVSPGVMLGGPLLELISSGGEEIDSIFDEAWARITMGRCSLPEEVANMVAFLATPAGPAGASVHGTTISVSGGMAG